MNPSDLLGPAVAIPAAYAVLSVPWVPWEYVLALLMGVNAGLLFHHLVRSYHETMMLKAAIREAERESRQEE